MGFLSRSKDGTPDNANALRFEDKAGEEQVWVQAQKNMDTHVKADATHVVGKNYHHYVGENEEHRVTKDQIIGVKGNSTMLTGNNKTDNAVGTYIIGSGESIRLECGKSIIELNQDGNINITGVNFNITVDKTGEINTGCELHLNPSDGVTAAIPPGNSHKEVMQSQLNDFLKNK
jgi:type VI secretion system secreted protein VgrG